MKKRSYAYLVATIIGLIALACVPPDNGMYPVTITSATLTGTECGSVYLRPCGISPTPISSWVENAFQHEDTVNYITISGEVGNNKSIELMSIFASICAQFWDFSEPESTCTESATTLTCIDGLSRVDATDLKDDPLVDDISGTIIDNYNPEYDCVLEIKFVQYKP